METSKKNIIIRLRAKGLSYGGIAKETGVNRNTAKTIAGGRLFGDVIAGQNRSTLV